MDRVYQSNEKGVTLSRNPFLIFGGAEGDRTPDLKTARKRCADKLKP